MKKINVLLLAFLLLSFWANAQQYPFNGLDMNMGNLSRLSNAQSRSISPENFTGEKGKGAMADPVRDKDVRNKANAAGPAKDLGKGWKVNPFGNYILLYTITKIIKGHITMYPFIIQSFFSFFFPFPSFLTLQERVFRKRGSRGSVFGL